MKQKIISAFGTAGYIVFLIIQIIVGYLLQFAPIIVLGLPFFVNFLLIIAMTSIPVLNIIVNLVVWIWALVVTIGGKQDWLAVGYYVVFGINALYVICRIWLSIPWKKTQAGE